MDQTKADLKHALMDRMPAEASKILTEMKWLKARTLLDLERYDDAEQACDEIEENGENAEKIQKFQAEVAKARKEHKQQEKELYKKMLNNKKKKEAEKQAAAEKAS